MKRRGLSRNNSNLWNNLNKRKNIALMLERDSNNLVFLQLLARRR